METLYRIAIVGTTLFASTARAEDSPVHPAALKPGDTIMFVAPAGDLNQERIDLAAKRLRERGYRVRIPETLFRQRGYLAGTDEQRAAELMEAFTDSEVDAIFPGTGGFGTTRMLDLLDYDTIAANPKVFIGFSDITGLHLAIGKKCNLVTFHSPNPQWGLGSPDGMPPFAERHFWPTIEQSRVQLETPYVYPESEAFGPLKVCTPGRCEGRLLGGNLSLVAALVGTPYQPDTEGKILFFEDINEAPYRVDRMLSQLRLAGMLDAPAGVILGQFRKCDPETHGEEQSLSLKRVFRDYFEGAPYPVVGNFSAGHVPDNATLAFGCKYAIDNARVALLEPPVFNSDTVKLSDAQWIPAFQGVDLTSIVLTQPRLLRVHVARIDLTDPGVSLRTNTDNGEKPEETDGLKTSSFVREHSCQLAVNGAPFWPVHASEGLPQNVAGLVVSDGKLVSPVDQEKPRPALVLRDGVASIESPPILLQGIDVAVGGFSCVLRDGRVIQDGSVAKHPRTAAGVADGGRTLFLAVVDGRQEGYSEGVTTEELGRLLRDIGADDGINLDGGGTTAMAIVDPDAPQGVSIVNRPIHAGIPGNERVSASHLGVFASPLSGSAD